MNKLRAAERGQSNRLSSGLGCLFFLPALGTLKLIDYLNILEVFLWIR